MILNLAARQSYAEWLPLLVPVLAAFLAYMLGALAYRKQREHELARRRYLDEGVDLVASRLQEAMSAYMLNWSHGVQVVKYLKQGGPVPSSLLDRSQLVMPSPAQMEATANYRLSALIGDPIFYYVQQLAVAFAQDASAFIRDDLCSAAELVSKGEPADVSSRDVAAEYFLRLQELGKESERYSWVIGRLGDLAAHLEQERFSFKKLEAFKEKPEVKSVVNRVREKFKDELADESAVAPAPPAEDCGDGGTEGGED